MRGFDTIIYIYNIYIYIYNSGRPTARRSHPRPEAILTMDLAWIRRVQDRFTAVHAERARAWRVLGRSVFHLWLLLARDARRLRELLVGDVRARRAWHARNAAFYAWRSWWDRRRGRYPPGRWR
jgi:hypothetical protein